MARIRSIKPEFPHSESMGRVSRDARLTFVELWTLADDAGRLRGNSRMLASLLFPYDDDAPGLIDAWLGELEREACIVRYQIDGANYVQVCNWLTHQKIDKPSRSKLPEPKDSSRDLANPREESSEDQGSRIKDQGSKDQDARANSGSLANPREESSKVTRETTSDREGELSLQAAYPKRSGRENWLQALHHARIRVSDDGETWESLEAAVRRYAAWCTATNATGTQHVMDPANFFGAADRPWLQEWSLPSPKVVSGYKPPRSADEAEAEAKARGEDIWALPGEPGYAGGAR